MDLSQPSSPKIFTNFSLKFPPNQRFIHFPLAVFLTKHARLNVAWKLYKEEIRFNEIRFVRDNSRGKELFKWQEESLREQKFMGGLESKIKLAPSFLSE